MNEIDIYKKDPSQFYSGRFFRKMQRSKPWQVAVGKMIVSMYNIESAVDFGCGLGFYLEGILEAGVSNVSGFEYMYDNAKQYIAPSMIDSIEYGDVMEPINCGQFDCVISTEVAEHILPEKTDIFVENITNASSKFLMFTAAPPGQGGSGHINERPQEFWIDKIVSKGFVLSPEDIGKIQNGFKRLPFRSKYMNLIRKQIMWFYKEN